MGLILSSMEQITTMISSTNKPLTSQKIPNQSKISQIVTNPGVFTLPNGTVIEIPAILPAYYQAKQYSSMKINDFSYDVLPSGLTSITHVGANYYNDDPVASITITENCNLLFLSSIARYVSGGGINPLRIRIKISRNGNDFFTAYYLAGVGTGNALGGSLEMPMFDYPLLVGDIVEIAARGYWYANTTCEFNLDLEIRK